MRSESTRFLGQPRLTNAYVPLDLVMNLAAKKHKKRKNATLEIPAHSLYLFCVFCVFLRLNSRGEVFVKAIAHDVDPLGASAQKSQHLLNDFELAELFVDLGHGGRQQQTFAEEQFESGADRVDLETVHTGAFHADDVDAGDVVESLLDDKGRNVLARRGTAAHHRQPSDAHKLMHGSVAGEKDVILQDAMASYQGTIRQDAAIADDAIVSNVAVGHEEVVIADHGFHRIGGAAMDRHVLPEDVAI